MPTRKEILEIGGREVAVSNPDKVYFPKAGHTKMDLINYYLAVADGALRGVAGRPMALKRFVDGAEGEAFFQKRAPENRPDWIDTAELTFPSGRTADEVVLREAAGLAWVANLGCIDLNPHPVRAEDLDHPDELRVDLDPVPGIEWSQIREVAMVCREALEAVGLVGGPKTSGSRGIHINVRIEPRRTYPEVRRAALAPARDVERRAPTLATSKGWKEGRHRGFLDYNQNAKERPAAVAAGDPNAGLPTEWEGSGSRPTPTGRRKSAIPVIEISRAAKKTEALEGFERWKERHPAAAAALEPADVLVDGMRGRSSLWYRVRVNLIHVPEADRPAQEALDPDYDPWAGYEWPDRAGQLERAPRKKPTT